MPFGFREDFHGWADAFDDRRADEDHFERLVLELGSSPFHFARQLPPIAVPEHRDIQKPERGLRGVVYLASEKNRTSAGTEDCAAPFGKLRNAIEQSFFLQELKLRRAFAAGHNQSVTSFEVCWAKYKGMLHAHARKRRAVGLAVSWHCRNPDLHFVLL